LKIKDVFGVAIELSIQENDEKSSVKLSPTGDVKGGDGRKFQIKTDYVVANSQKSGDILIRLEHGWTDHNDRAIGWIAPNSLKVENSFIVGDVELTEWGQTLVNSKEYRFLSPEYQIDGMVDGSYVVNNITGFGLVNRPNFKKLKLNSEESGKEMEKEKIEKLEKDIADKDIEINSLKEKLNINEVEIAIAKGEIMENQKDFALSLNSEQRKNFISANSENMKQLKGLSGLANPKQNSGSSKLELNSLDPEIQNLVFGEKKDA
jgi:phage I-like protein